MTPSYHFPSPGTLPRGRSWFAFLGAAVWLAVTLVSLGMLWKVENVPGPRKPVPPAWPAASHIARTPGLPTLVMFAHPRCPCTRAGVEELAMIVARCNGLVQATVLFYKPGGASDGWARSSSWSDAAAIPGVQVRTDDDGVEANRFGATTSGFVLLYDATGTLAFQGGITAERGHSGDNEGVDAIAAILHGDTPRTRDMPVLGCLLADPDTGRSPLKTQAPSAPRPATGV